MVLNKDAWDILMDDEKLALSLQHSMDKSTWESGEIMNRSHYKYLEIKYRAEHFLKIFTEHFDLFNDLFPTYITGNREAIEFFNQCIRHRKKPIEAQAIVAEKFGKYSKHIIKLKIIATIRAWDKGENAHNKMMSDLVKEFDRWNNFRILPKELQEPSAFKRRIKNVYKRQIKMLHELHPLAIDRIRELYEVTKKKQLFTYLPIVTSGPEVIKVIINSNSSKIFNELGLYTFDDLDTANEYLSEVMEYQSKVTKDCLDGLKFWPKYRETIKKANNYDKVMNISTSRRYLQLAMEKFELL